MHRDGGGAHHLELEMLPQPTDTTCGPTCLHALYRFYGDELELGRVISEVVPLTSGGTLAVGLGNHALQRGYRATIHTLNLQLFDPTWFEEGVALDEKLEAQAEAKEDPKLQEATRAHLTFLKGGGKVRFGVPKPDQIYQWHGRSVPLLTGLSATYLYGNQREYLDKPNDVHGAPVGHFVVLAGSDPPKARVLVADPLGDKTDPQARWYWVDTDRLISSILLGVLTYDASVLVIERDGR